MVPNRVLFEITRLGSAARSIRAQANVAAFLVVGAPLIVDACRATTAPEAPDPATKIVWKSIATLAQIGSRGGNLTGIWGSSPNDIWIVADNGNIHHFNGSAWSFEPSGNSLSDVWGRSATDVWAWGYEKILHYDGTKWSLSHKSSLAHFRGLWGNSPSNVWAVGFSDSANAGIIAHYDGSAWSTSYLTYADYPVAVWGASSTDLWAVGYTRTSDGVYSGFITHNDGGSWSTALTNSRSPFAVWGSSRSFVVAVGGDYAVDGSGIVLGYDGSKWSTSWTGLASTFLTSISGTSRTNIWAAGDIVRHFDGTRWSTVPGPSASVAGLWTSSPSEVWAIDGLQVYRGTLPSQ
jgi:hypothetical protein